MAGTVQRRLGKGDSALCRTKGRGQGANRMNPLALPLWSGYSSPTALNKGTTFPLSR